MSKLKKLLPGFFGSSSSTKNAATGAVCEENRLETDALPVHNNYANANANANTNTSSGASLELQTPGASADLTESVVRELSDPNYNSMGLAHSVLEGVALAVPTATPIDNANNSIIANTSNTMNVHNAQQQIVMNFENASNVHFGTVYNYNNNVNARKGSSCSGDTVPPEFAAAVSAVKAGNVASEVKAQKVYKTRTIVEMMQSQEELTHRMRDTIATHLGQGWRDVMRDLGLSNGEIEQAVIDHHTHGLQKEVIYQLLLKWERSAEDNEATLGRITTLLWKLNQREIVERMKFLWKSERARR